MTERFWFITLTAAAVLGCSHNTAEARRMPTTPDIVTTAPVSPYGVQLIDESGSIMDLYSHRGRHYVVGNHGSRYTIRITNPTPNRVEAVVSVDGLDVIDGKSADFREKRGYIIPAYGSVDIDGWRTSLSEVAAFRFSTVARSYAARKGKGRNVGVIGVAFFEERVYQPQIPPPLLGRGYDGDRSVKSDDSAAPSSAEGGQKSARTKDRPGLGTGWGEQRQSVVQYTQFVRAAPKNPSRVVSLRYNDVDGLRRLGLVIPPPPPVYSWEDDVALRESANPFPGGDFATPPPM